MEIWKDSKINNIEVSNLGNVRRKDTKKTINPTINSKNTKNGRKVLIVAYWDKTTSKCTSISLRKLVYETFVSDVKPECRLVLKDGNYLNNSLDNIEEVDIKDLNAKTIPNGEKCYSNKIPEKDVRNIKILLLRNDIQKLLYKQYSSSTVNKIAKKYNVDTATIRAMQLEVIMEEDNNFTVNQSRRWKKVIISEEEIQNIIEEELFKFKFGIKEI